jgi:hypothetical protein
MFISQPAKTSSTFNAIFSLDTDIPMAQDLARIALAVDLTITDAGAMQLVNKYINKVELLANGNDPVYTWLGADLPAWALRYGKVAARNEQCVTTVKNKLRIKLECPTARAIVGSSLLCRVTFFGQTAVGTGTVMATSVTVSYESGPIPYSGRLEQIGAGGATTKYDVPISQNVGLLSEVMVREATEYFDHFRINDRNSKMVLDEDWTAVRANQQELLHTVDAAGLYGFIPLSVPVAVSKDTLLRVEQSTAEAIVAYFMFIQGVNRPAGSSSKLLTLSGGNPVTFADLRKEAAQVSFMASPVGSV